MISNRKKLRLAKNQQAELLRSIGKSFKQKRQRVGCAPPTDLKQLTFTMPAQLNKR